MFSQLNSKLFSKLLFVEVNVVYFTGAVAKLFKRRVESCRGFVSVDIKLLGVHSAIARMPLGLLWRFDWFTSG